MKRTADISIIFPTKRSNRINIGRDDERRGQGIPFTRDSVSSHACSATSCIRLFQPVIIGSHFVRWSRRRRDLSRELKMRWTDADGTSGCRVICGRCEPTLTIATDARSSIICVCILCHVTSLLHYGILAATIYQNDWIIACHKFSLKPDIGYRKMGVLYSLMSRRTLCEYTIDL